MFINPFVSINQQLEDLGWIMEYEGDIGFTFAKKVGIEVFHVAQYRKDGICFYDGVAFYEHETVPVNEKELMLFAKKIKEWKEQYEDKSHK